MFKKILSLSLITLMLFSCVAVCSASRINIDGDWRLTHRFTISDLSKGIIWEKDVAAGDGHHLEINGDLIKNHTLLISVEELGNKLAFPGKHNILVRNYDGGDIWLFAKLKYCPGACYDSSLQYVINNNWNIFSGLPIPETYGAVTI